METDSLAKRTTPSLTNSSEISLTAEEYEAYLALPDHSRPHRGNGDDPRIVDLHLKIACHFARSAQMTEFVIRLERLRVLCRIDGTHEDHETYALDEGVWCALADHIMVIPQEKPASDHDEMIRQCERRIELFAQEEQDVSTRLEAVKKVIAEERDQHRQLLEARETLLKAEREQHEAEASLRAAEKRREKAMAQLHALCQK